MSHVQKGLIISLIMIVLSVIVFIAGLSSSSWPQFLIFGIFIAGIIWSCVRFSKDMNGNITFGSVFGHGFKTTAVITCLMLAFAVAFTLLFPELKELALDEARKNMEQNPNVTDEQIDEFIQGLRDRWILVTILGTLFGYLIAGLIASLIGAGVAKKNPQPIPFQ